MSDHVIIQVRDAILARIKGLFTTGPNALLYTETELPETLLPCVMIQYQEDSTEPISLGYPALVDVGPVFLLHCVVKQKDDFEQAAFLVRSEVEAALFGTAEAKSLGGLVQWIRCVAAEGDRHEAAEIPAYRLTLQVQARLRHLESRPDSFNLS